MSRTTISYFTHTEFEPNNDLRLYPVVFDPVLHLRILYDGTVKGMYLHSLPT